MQEKDAKKLLKKYFNGIASEEEKALLEAWYIRHSLTDLPDIPETVMVNQADRIRNKLIAHSHKTRTILPRIAAVASILIALSFGGYYFLYNNHSTPSQFTQNQTNDITPGGNGATLTLGNGTKIILNAQSKGQLALQGNMSINNTANGQLKYQPTHLNNNSVLINTITTLRKQQYSVVLSDGTKVWLNTASSITFPNVFQGKNREVSITGEAYFEVVHNSAHPFKVKVKGQTIEDLGTHFNINAYDDEASLKATLLEGKIRIRGDVNTVTLKPGQQGEINRNNAIIKVNSDVNTDEVTAWHRGLFEFHNADIQTIMRQLARWYDVEVTYEGKPTDRVFSGKIYRNINAIKVSDILNYSNIHFRIDGRKIVVMP